MFKLFSGGGANDGSWPLSKIITSLKGQYGNVDTLGEDGPLKVYGVADNGINFVVALMQTGPGSGNVVELGFLARFVGFPVSAQAVEALNRNLHISVASIENGDLFLMAGLQVTGVYDDTQFSRVLDSWRRDLMVTLNGINRDNASMAGAFPAAKLAAARDFAINRAPDPGGDRPIDMLSSFLGAKSAIHAVCDDCGGRGKRGLIARSCSACDGTGFV